MSRSSISTPTRSGPTRPGAARSRHCAARASPARAYPGRPKRRRLLLIGKGDDDAAPDLLAGWFERNLKLTANLIKIVDSPDERIVFLVGSGHLHLVRELAAGSGAFAVESATDYLDPTRQRTAASTGHAPR